MENNKIITIQEMLMREMQRLDDDEFMKQGAKEEVARSNALTNTAMAYIKGVNLQLRVKEVAQTNEMTSNALSKELGIRE